MEFGKRHDTTDTTDFARANLLQTYYGFATDLLRTCRLCCGLAVDLLLGSRQLVTVCYGENGVVDFGLINLT